MQYRPRDECTPYFTIFTRFYLGLGRSGGECPDENDQGISQSQTHTFTKISIGSQTDLEILLLYVQNLQQAFKPPPPEPTSAGASNQEPIGSHEVEIEVEEAEDVDNEDKNTEDNTEDEDEDREEVISPSSLSVPQKVQFFEDFSKDKEYCSYAQAYSLNITSSQWSCDIIT